MPKTNNLQNIYDKGIYCPFYKGTEKSQVIRCEGPIARTIIRVGFPGKTKFKEYLAEYCQTRKCEFCRVYQCANAKYEEEEKWGR